jgi:hypothetical protein
MRLATLVGMPTRGPRPPRKPPRPDEREIQFAVKLSRAELDAFHRAADAVGLATSAWARTILRRAAGLPAV